MATTDDRAPLTESSSATTGESMRAQAQFRPTGTVQFQHEPMSYSQPVAAPTSGSYAVNVVTRQPQLVPIQNSFDAESLATYSLINQQHPETANQLESVITSTGSAVQRMATDQSLETQVDKLNSKYCTTIIFRVRSVMVKCSKDC